MGQVKAYGEWAKNKGHLDKNYNPIKKGTEQMDWVDDYIKDRDSNMASSHSNKLKNIRRKNEIKSIKT